jgi:hypothetical protein
LQPTELTNPSSQIAWRIPLALQFIFIIILFATVPWLPESPRWLVAQNRIDEAELILADIEGTTIDNPYVQTELKEIRFTTAYEREHQVRIRDLLRGKKSATATAGSGTLRRLFLGMGAQFMQQFSGKAKSSPQRRNHHQLSFFTQG